MPSRSELVAYSRDASAVATAIGADVVIFQDLDDLVDAVRQFNPTITKFDCSVFDGEYVTGSVDEAYLQHVENLRSDNVRGKLYGNTALADSKTGINDAMNGEIKRAVNAISDAPSNTHSDETVGLHNSYNSN